MEACHAVVCYGMAEFVDPHKIRVSPRNGENSQDLLLQGEFILIATGSAPVHPPGFPFDSNEIYDSDTILNLAACRESRRLDVG
jgi:NAD(P) transhydrogenase